MEVFSFEEEVRSGKTPVPFEQSAAAAAEALHQLEQLLAPSSDAEAMVSGESWLQVPQCMCCCWGRIARTFI